MSNAENSQPATGGQAPQQRPSIGRIVHFRGGTMGDHLTGPQAAIITQVHNDTCVNLSIVADLVGGLITKTSCVLGIHWDWPPRV
jgi:hypothetical protein